MKTGCWLFISSLASLKCYSKEYGIDAVRRHLQDCERCHKDYRIHQGKLFCELRKAYQ
jgi:hypothetical protein